MLDQIEVAAIRTAKQMQEAEQFGSFPRRNIFWETRLGKTGAGTQSLAIGVPDLRRGVVTAPYGVCPWWSRSLADAGYTPIPLYEIDLKDALDALRAAGPRAVAVTNYQRLPMTAAHRTRPRAGDVVPVSLGEVLRAWGPDAMIVDESHMIASPSSKRGRQVRELAWQIPWVRCLSGTPAPNNWGDLWGSLAALDPVQWGYFYAGFADRWLLRDAVYHRVYAYRDPEEFRALVAACSSFLRREDVFGPDQWVINTREVEMPALAAKRYAQLAREWLIEDNDERLLVDGSHILTRLVRLQQIASGYIVGDDAVERDLHHAKIDMVEGDLHEIVASGQKAIVFHRFTWEGKQMEQRAKRLKCPVYIINGNVPAHERDHIVQQVSAGEGPIVAIVQTQSGGVGIDFSEATYALVMSQGFSFVDERQARDRIFKPGVPRHVMYYQTQGTVDEFIAQVQDVKSFMHNDLLHFDRNDMAFGKTRKHKQVHLAPFKEAI